MSETLTQTRPIVRPATFEDYRAFYGKPPEHSVRAWVMEVEGVIIGIGGVHHQRMGMSPYIFSDIKQEARRYKKFMVRAAIKGLKALDADRVLAIASPEEPGSVKFLTYLGFKHFATSVRGEIFQWRRS